MDERERSNGHSKEQPTSHARNGLAPALEAAAPSAETEADASASARPVSFDRLAQEQAAAATEGTTHADAATLAPHLVALLFAADEPLPLADAARILGAGKRLVEQAAALLLDAPPIGLIVQRDGDRLQLATGPASATYVRRLRGLEDQARLSRAALEVLAVVAYRQPITRAEIEAVRGVGGDRALSTLLQRELIQEVGRKDTVGRPVLFGTTLGFLEHLGLRSLADLPPIPSPTPTSADETPVSDAIMPPGPSARLGTSGDGAAPEREGAPVH